VGIGRSGTSLLQSILFHQEGITVYPEIQLFRRFLVANNTAKKRVTDREIVRIFRKENPRFSNLQTAVNIEGLEEGKYKINEIVDLFRKNEDAILFKDARNLDYLSKISSHFNDIKAICTVRDLRDVILSRMKADFSKRWGTLLNLIIMRYQYSSLLKFEKEQKVHFIRYEDFTNGNFDSLHELGIITIGLQDIDLTQIAEHLFSDEELSKHKSKNRKTVDPGNFEKWKEELPKRTLFMVELFFSDYLKRFGYETVHKGNGISVGNKMIKYLCSATHILYQWVSVYRDKRVYKL
jgi:hypothetical protein